MLTTKEAQERLEAVERELDEALKHSRRVRSVKSIDAAAERVFYARLKLKAAELAVETARRTELLLTVTDVTEAARKLAAARNECFAAYMMDYSPRSQERSLTRARDLEWLITQLGLEPDDVVEHDAESGRWTVVGE